MLDEDKDGETASTCGSASDLENDKKQQVSVPGRTYDGLMEQASVPGCTRGLIIKRQWIDKILAHQKVAWIIEYV